MKKHTFDELNTLYNDGESADKTLFSEMRNNVLLHSSNHWSKVSDKLRERLKNSNLSETVKLKLTKNHIQVVTKTYINNIVGSAPGVQVCPYNENELQDEKDSRLSQAVWEDGEDKQCIDEKIEKWALSLVVIGECASETYFDPNKGALKGYRQKVNELGQPVFNHPEIGEIAHPVDEMGQPLQPAPDMKQPVFEGELCIDVVHPFNIIRDKGAESMKDSKFLCVRRMMDISEAKALVENSDLTPEEKEERLKYIVESGKGTFRVFDVSRGDYHDAKDQVLIRKYYFRPCVQYPTGYYYITTDSGVLFEGEIPFGDTCFPLVIEGFDEIPTSPRSESIIKVLRAPQAEINRMASAKAYHSVVMGSDKIVTQLGSKLQKGNSWDGIREFVVNGPAPTIIPGRSGDQFAASIDAEIAELYRLANLEYEKEERQIQDPYAMLFTSMRQRKKYSMYVKKFERFLCNTAKLYLKLAKRYFDDQRIIRAVGRREQLNIAEFKNISDDGFNIKLKPMAQDLDTMFGKSLQIREALQYGKDIPPHIQAMMIKQFPFINDDQSLKLLTIDMDKIESDILALDRGESRPAEREDKHDLYIQILSYRKKQGDFRSLSPQIQQMYEQKIQEHRTLEAQLVQELKAAQAEFLPMDGPMVKIDMYGPDGKRMLAPLRALEKFMEMLEQQGMAQEKLQMLDQYNQVQVLKGANQPSQQMGMGSAVGMQQPPPMPA